MVAFVLVALGSLISLIAFPLGTMWGICNPKNKLNNIPDPPVRLADQVHKNRLWLDFSLVPFTDTNLLVGGTGLVGFRKLQYFCGKEDLQKIPK